MTEHETLKGLVDKLESINLSLQNGVEALACIAQVIEDETASPESRACYFVADSLRVQQRELQEVIEAAMAARRACRLTPIEGGGGS